MLHSRSFPNANDRHRLHSPALVAGVCAALSGCGGGSSGGAPPPPATYTVGGTVSGLSGGASMVLLDNGADSLTVSANGSFTFKTALASGSAYAVTVGTQPSGETCTVSSGSGTVGSSNVTSVSVACAATAPPAYTIGGTLSGLAAGASVALLDNGADSLKLTANGTFTFKTPLARGSVYAVTVGTQPAGETCSVSNGSGKVGSADVTNVAVSCAAVTASETWLYSFGPFGGPDGSYGDGLIRGSDGNFHGITESGGSHNVGTVFEITPAGVETVVYSFGPNVINGVVETTDPRSIFQASDGNFYGVTNNGGADDFGTVFEISSGVGSILYAFGPLDSTGALNGSYPTGLIQGSDGNFYGTTTSGGSGFLGTVFKMTPSGTETVIHAFGPAGGTDGGSPIGNLVEASDGNFYGATTGGGANNTGTVFMITPAGAETVLYSFGPKGGTDGQTPSGGLLLASDGNFYGLTSTGGANGTGTVFKITPSGSESVLYSFGPPVNDQDPRPIGALIEASDGNLYGTTQAGGSLNGGTVFKVTPSGMETVLHSFTAEGTDGAAPLAGVVQGSDGNLYGTASGGGANGTGGVFKITL
ncbi:MAG TPA: choice-of-anchor tandem repeat GloVer-containing protein, partial [Steroidobacteraceae bacterium]|nr:choice-of-anchor tandem repeat GloVer-containing protein [Steroidobacteraceae bacterium]